MKLSAHFDSNEFRCRCGACGEPLIAPELIEGLEAWRAILHANLTEGQMEHRLLITSGCRCVVWNQHEGGKASSQHLYNPHTGLPGRAADVHCPTRSLGEIYEAALQVPAFQGIGLAPPVAPEPSKGRQAHPGYIHVDVRATLARVQWGYDEDGRTVALARVLPRVEVERGELG